MQCQSIRPCTRLLVRPSVCLSTGSFACPLVRPSVHLPVHWSVCSFTGASACVLVHPSFHLPVRLSAHPLVRLPIHRSVYPSTGPSGHPMVRLPIHRSVCPSTGPSARPQVRLPIHWSVCLSAGPSARPQVRLPVHRSVCPSTGPFFRSSVSSFAWCLLQVFTIDVRNHGNSTHTAAMDFHSMAADVEQWCSELGVEKTAVLGHSMGGKIAMTLALTKVSSNNHNWFVVKIRYKGEINCHFLSNINHTTD